jgi:hypothetical protein
MLEEFEALLQGGPREVTIDYSSPHRDHALERLSSLDRVEVIGDIALYYLPYVDRLALHDLDIRMPCLRRDREATVRSYMKKLEVRDRRRRWNSGVFRNLLDSSSEKLYRNHLVEHEGDRWVRDRKWDKCYPTFDATGLEDALRQYWDHYYETAAKLEATYPSSFKVFEMEELNTEEGQKSILRFLGYEDSLALGSFHMNESRTA